MSYELYITRARNWLANKGDEITATEWVDIVTADPELSFSSDSGPYFAVWSGKSQYEIPWLDWKEGNIYSTYPDKALLGKMLQLADKFGARVQGEEGEEGEAYHSVDDIDDAFLSASATVINNDHTPPIERIENKHRIIEFILIAAVIAGLAIWRNWPK